MTSIGAIDRMIFSNPHVRTKVKSMLASIGFDATHWLRVAMYDVL